MFLQKSAELHAQASFTISHQKSQFKNIYKKTTLALFKLTLEKIGGSFISFNIA